MSTRRFTLLAGLAGLLVLLAAPAAASETADAPKRGTEVRPINKLDGVELDVAVARLGAATNSASRRDADQAGFQLGEHIEVCFTASAAGWVTVWSDDLIDVPVRIFPNPYSGNEQRAQQVQAGERLCVGDHPRFALEIAEPAGDARINVIWTAALEDQVGEDEYAATRSVTRREQPARQGDVTRYAAQSIDYRIVREN